MAYKLFDREGREVILSDTENKISWCRDGETNEEAFIRKHGKEFGYQINPEKTTNPYAPDLLFVKSGVRADLKGQTTPFFTSLHKYGIDPTYAVVFNLKDRIRYKGQYPGIQIIFWIDWQSVMMVMGDRTFNAEYLYGVWRTSFLELDTILDACPLHGYQRRQNDTKGNAKSSFVIDIRAPIFERLI